MAAKRKAAKCRSGGKSVDPVARKKVAVDKSVGEDDKFF